MKSNFILLALIILANHTHAVEFFEGDANTLKLSKENENLGVRKLKAILLPCESLHKDVKCKTRIDIKAWLNPSQNKENTLLVIDEVYDVKKRLNFPLLHPYMIQLAQWERTLKYPLQLHQSVDVLCDNNESVQRKDSDSINTLKNKVDKETVGNLWNAIKMKQGDAIKRDSLDLHSSDVTDVDKNDLLLYSDEENLLRKHSPPVSDDAFKIFGWHNKSLDNTLIKSFKPSVKEFNSYPMDNQSKPQNENELNQIHHQQYQQFQTPQNLTALFSNNFKFNSSPKVFEMKISDWNSTKKQFPNGGDIHNDQNHKIHHQSAKNFIGFPSIYINESQTRKGLGRNKNFDYGLTKTRRRVENDNLIQKNLIEKKIHKKVSRNKENSFKNEIYNHNMNENDKNLKRNTMKNLEMDFKIQSEDTSSAKFPSTERRQFNQNNQRHYAKLQENSNEVSSFNNYKQNPIDSFPISKGRMKQWKDVYENHHTMNVDNSESFQVGKDAEDESRMNEMIIENDFYDEFVPDKEDDPNLMVEEKSFKPNRNAKQEVNSEQTEKRFKRFFLNIDDGAALRTSNNYNQTDGNSEVEMKQEPIKGKRFSVYRLASPFIHFSLRVEVFRKHFGKWLRICPQMILTSESENFSDGDFHVGLSPRNTSNYFPDFDVNKTFILLSEDGTSIQSLLTLDNSSSLSITTAIRQSICRSEIGADTAAQSSLLMLSETVLNHEQAITKCSLNDDKFCLALKDDDDTTWKLNLDFPFGDNEIIDSRSTKVKISNIYIDTIDQVNLEARFEVISNDYIVKKLNLTLNGCEILSHVEISQSFILPPNKLAIIDVSMTLPLYAIYKEQICEASIVDEAKKIVARRQFILNPKGARCLCLWHCDCYCFDSFLSKNINDLCHAMSLKAEIDAGFYDEDIFLKLGEDIETSENIKRNFMKIIPLLIPTLALCLGLIKASLGCCFLRVGELKYNYVYPFLSYQKSSRCRRFAVNLFFFLLLPIACLRSFLCCFHNEKEKSEDSVYGFKMTRREIDSDDESDEENMKLIKHSSTTSNFSSTYENSKKSSDTIFDARNFYSDENELEKDTEFVVSSIKESHESLSKLENHRNKEKTFDEIFDDTKEKPEEILVKQFLNARVVFRTFTEPKGSVKVVENQPYSIRGYFIPAQNTGYQFITYNPIRQFYGISQNNTLVSLTPQNLLNAKAFRRFYANKKAVLEANDLSVHPTLSAPCVNVLVQDLSMYRCEVSCDDKNKLTL